MPLHTRILLGLAVGVLAGVSVNLALGPADPRVQWTVENITNPVGQLFLRLLLMTVVPLVFSSLVAGVAGIGDIRKLGRVGFKSLLYTFGISAISVVIALTVANVVAPGKRIAPDTAAALQARYGTDAAARVASAQAASKEAPLLQVIRTIVPSNPITAAAGDPPNMLHIMFFALVLGIAITLVPNHASEPVINLMDGLFAISTKIIELIMYIAPFAVACLLFSNTASFGLDLLGALIWYMVTVLAGLAIHMFGVYSLSLKLLSRVFPADQDRHADCVRDLVFECDAADCSARRRERARDSTGDQQLRAHGGSYGESERDGSV